MDIVENIAMASTDASDKPLEDVIIEKYWLRNINKCQKKLYCRWFLL